MATKKLPRERERSPRDKGVGALSSWWKGRRMTRRIRRRNAERKCLRNTLQSPCVGISDTRTVELAESVRPAGLAVYR